ncbi:NAD-binding lipoprotein [Streptomyces sp. ASQP_92]|uniref:CASTOR/POLLUX-related putative ion channel n=1 Tax=Streptomyces sp. ASQP_92 TaxID=2979116 RepID=UPI0021BFC169|nr:TrkA C-terminal domain-containing protein [Streptomyces sp. ASQP_92]MCT9093603.1 NAD-binding lipoprotein [Streptomyces sp. ASQP_92]
MQYLASLWRRLQYRFDNLVSRSTSALIGWLLLICLAAVVPTSVLLVQTGRRPPATLTEQAVAVWVSVGQTLKIGGAVGPPLYVLASVLLALVALLFVSTLVSLITTGINRRIMRLRLGHSTVLEVGHTVVLGWSDQIFPVVAELVSANSNQSRAALAILAPKDKVEMEDEISARITTTGTTTIVCRNGCTTDPAVLARVSPHTAKAVLVLAPGTDDGDAHVVKTLLALNAPALGAAAENTVRPDIRDRDRSGSGAGTGAKGDAAVVVAAVRDTRNRLTAALAAGPRGRVLAVDDIVARLLVQTARQPGLSLVYQELLDFAGDEFYAVPADALVGRTFGEALLAYITSSVVGLLRADDKVVLNPDAETTITADDRIIVVTRDDDTAVLEDATPYVDADAFATAPPRAPRPERLLLLGWNRRAPLVVGQLASYASAGTTLDIVALEDAETTRVAHEAAAQQGPIEVRLHCADITDPVVLEALDVPSFDGVIVIADPGNVPADHLNSRPVRPDVDDGTLVTLLHLRAIEEATGQEISLTTEMSDDRNRLLAPAREGADFIVSGRLISLLMCQISESPYLASLFDELFTSEGNELYLRPATDYVRPGGEVTFATVVASARRRKECAVGYRLRAQSTRSPMYGVRLNPDKREPVRLTAEDWVIVVAEG